MRANKGDSTLIYKQVSNLPPKPSVPSTIEEIITALAKPGRIPVFIWASQ